MIPAECKRLAEVDFPIAVVSRHSAREKSIRHGHPSTLHLWWARRPLAACRSMLLALLVPDPCDEHCPTSFCDEARAILEKLFTVSKGDMGLREALLRFIGEFANWDLSANPAYLEAARKLVKAAHGSEPPLVVDPFAGGGSIPLEALRLGCDAFASDLNPVACQILKTLLEDIPRHGPKLAEELRAAGAEIKASAEKELAEFYPPDPDGGRPIAYLWARTVCCEAPDCGAEIPLLRSVWLSKKAGGLKALRPVVRKKRPPRVDFEIYTPSKVVDVGQGTVNNGKATCLCCDRILSPERTRAQLLRQRGGTAEARMVVVVTQRPGRGPREYRLPTNADRQAVAKAGEALRKLISTPGAESWTTVPDEKLNPVRPSPNARGLSAVTRIGMSSFGDLFTARQKLALLTYCRIVAERPKSANTTAHARFLALGVSRLTDICNALCRWETTKTQVRNLFGRQTIKVVWDFAEPSVVAEQAGDFAVTLGTMIRVVSALSFLNKGGQVECADASQSPLPDDAVSVWFTDPPYYDAIPYADLADFFYVWLKRALPAEPSLRNKFDGDGSLTPKLPECVWNQAYKIDGIPKDPAFFERTLGKAFDEGRRVLRTDGIACIVFAHKSTEGWEALLNGMLAAGWCVTASWPIATELANRPNARDSAALATSVHLLCRPRNSEKVGDWGAVLRELPKRVGDWMGKLSAQGVRGADLVFACIGPALEIFSRYSRVETPEGREVKLDEYLAKIWETVGRKALEQILGTADTRVRKAGAPALEEDARLTALFLWTLQATDIKAEENSQLNDDEAEDHEEGERNGKGGYSLIYDVVRRFAQPLGIRLEDWEGRVIQTEKGVVRLLSLDERAQSLFGDEGASAVAKQIESDAAASAQLTLFAEESKPVAARIRKSGKRSRQAAATSGLEARRQATTLDNVHAAMLLQRSGRTNALRKLLEAEIQRGPEFLRLANALSALYPKESEDKRLLDAMLLAAPRT